VLAGPGRELQEDRGQWEAAEGMAEARGQTVERRPQPCAGWGWVGCCSAGSGAKGTYQDG
jgi:elongation factor P hydroxylase